MKSTRFYRVVSCALIIGLAISSCTPEKRALLRTTAGVFADQSIAAIDSTQTIYEVTEPIQSPYQAMEDTVREVLENTGLDYYWGNIREVDQMIIANQPNSTPSSLKKELDAVKDEYRTAALLYEEVEKVDYESPRLVKEAKESAKRLTLKMYILGKRILENPPRPLDSKRVVLSINLGELDYEYHHLKTESSNTHSKTRKAEIEKRLVEIKKEVREKAEEWLTINKNEKKMLCDTVIQTQKATTTGIQLSKLSDEYEKVDIDIIFGRVNEFVGIASNLTGKDYSNISTQSTVIAKKIESDQNLKQLLSEIMKGSSPNSQSITLNVVNQKQEKGLDCSSLGGN